MHAIVGNAIFEGQCWQFCYATTTRAIMNQSASSHKHITSMVRAMCCVGMLIGMPTYMAQAQIKTATLLGYVYDEASKKGIPNARITVYRNDHDFKTGNTDLIQGGCNTDMHGLFCRLSGLGFDSTYVFVVSAPGYRTVPIKNCPIKFSMTFLELGLQLTSDTLPSIVVLGGCANERSEQFKEAFNKREKSKPYTGCVQDSDGRVGSIRGIRGASTDTYKDGVKVQGKGVSEPKEPIPIILNGTPASIGDNQPVPQSAGPK